MKTDELIEKMYGILRVQLVDMPRAMYESGIFSLNHKYKTFKMNEAVWRSKTEEEKKTVFEKFLKPGVTKMPETVVSTDGKYEVKHSSLSQKIYASKVC